MSFWKDKLQKLQKIPEEEIQKKLQLSYDELDDETEKAIFLDIAFFFVGKDKDEAVHTFNSCGYYPNSGITILVERCLLTIDEYNKFQMHNLIRDMGRKLGESKGLFWRGNSWEDLEKLKGANKIEGLIVDLSKSTEKRIPAKIFEKLPNLRLLEMIDAHDINKNFKNSFRELRCIRWSNCSWTHWPSSFSPQKLASLDMPFNKFKALWKYTAPLASLKTINLSYSKNLNSTYDFRDLKLLERLLLRGCQNLLEVHPSIGELTNLVHLDLGECPSLKELPQSFGQLTNLDHLDLDECDQLKEIPESIGQLTNLCHFDLRDCHSLKRIPEPTKQLVNLGFLDMSRCSNLKVLPEQLCDMHGLKRLNISDTTIEQLPDQFGRLTNLVDLRLSHCRNLSSFPPGIWKLKSLEFFYLNSCLELMNLEQSSLQVCWCWSLPPCAPYSRTSVNLSTFFKYKNKNGSRIGREARPFTAYLPNRKIPEWFDYKSSERAVSLDIPPLSGGKFLGVVLWVVYTCKNANRDCFSMGVIITNHTQSTETYIGHLLPVGKIQSMVMCMKGEEISVKNGDKIKVSLDLYSFHGHEEVEVEMCGAHVIIKEPIPCKQKRD